MGLTIFQERAGMTRKIDEIFDFLGWDKEMQQNFFMENFGVKYIFWLETYQIGKALRVLQAKKNYSIRMENKKEKEHKNALLKLLGM